MLSFSSCLAVALAPVAILASGATAYTNPGAYSGQCEAHDPSVIQRASDGVYFRFNTGNRTTVWKSNALEGPWENKGAALPKGSSINLEGNQDLWAPDVQKVGDENVM
ncbi:arabinan endo-1-5-alpha-L-arabinosidase A [Apiospora sp. TS-2023a]